MENSDLSKSTLPRLSATIGNNWDTGIGEIGIVVSGSYARQDVAAFKPRVDRDAVVLPGSGPSAEARSEEHTSALPSLMRISYAAFCSITKTKTIPSTTPAHEASIKH